MKQLERRLNIYRDDLADIRLKDRVKAKRYVAGTPARVLGPFADMLSKPKPGASLDRQALHGEMLQVFEDKNGFSWIQRDLDNYTGYVTSDSLVAPANAPNHIVAVPRTFAYPGADLRFPRSAELSMGSTVNVTGKTETRGTRYAVLEDGTCVIEKHLRPIKDHAEDFVLVAETLIFTPYLWGGNSGFGIDCAGLIQLAMMMTGRVVPADSDLQAASIGEPVDTTNRKFDNLERGDLVFWQGHAGIMQDGITLLHSSGHTMNVASEPLMDAVARIAYLYDYPTIVRRPSTRRDDE